MVELEELENPTDIELLRDMIEKHHRYTGSAVAAGVLAQFEELLPHFVKVMPIEYKRALAELERERERESAISEETGELLEVAARG